MPANTSKKTVKRRRQYARSGESYPETNLSEDTADPDGPPTPLDAKELIGREVRFWRNERGLTGKKLADLAEVSPAMLTKIEQGKVSPSIQTLVAVAAALNVPVSMFFHRIEKSRYVSYVPAEKRMRVDRLGTRAGHVYELLGHNIGHSIAIEPFVVILDEEAEPYALFQEEGYKFLHVLEGEVIYRHGDRRFPLKEGDSLVFDAMSPHGPEKLVKVPARIMSIAIFSRFDPGVR